MGKGPGGQCKGGEKYLPDQRDPLSWSLNKNKPLDMLVPKKIAVDFSCSVIKQNNHLTSFESQAAATRAIFCLRW